MKEEYDIENLNPRKNPYSERLKKQIAINSDDDTIDSFKEQSEKSSYKRSVVGQLYTVNCC